jgi:hypothetical protein
MAGGVVIVVWSLLRVWWNLYGLSRFHARSAIDRTLSVSVKGNRMIGRRSWITDKSDVDRLNYLKGSHESGECLQG